MKRQTSLSHHVVQFSNFLRAKKFNIGPNEESDALKGLTIIDWSDPLQFKSVLKTSFCKDFHQTLQFDTLYNQYWYELSKAVDSKTKKVEEEKPQPVKKSPPSIQVIKNWLHGNQAPNEEQDLNKASDDALKSASDLMAYANDYARDWNEVIRLMQRYVAKKKTRRMVKSRKPVQVDFRKILKKSMQRGGEISQFEFKKKKVSKTNIVLLCDISKSMELYSKFVIQMMYALQNSSLRIHCFVFSTSLYSISRDLKRQSIQEALQNISEKVDEWSSGTKIGESLTQFHVRYSRKSLTKNTFTFVVSDGWDAGEISLLESAMKKLKRKSERLIWVNPLASNENYDPKVLGMKTALPYIDHLIPALDVSSLKRYLGKIA